MGKLDQENDNVETDQLKTSDSKIDLKTLGGEDSQGFDDLLQRQQSAKAYQENTDGRPTGPATDNFGRAEIFDGDKVLVKGAEDKTARVLKDGGGGNEEIGDKKDVDWVKELRQSTSNAATERRTAESVNAVYKDNSPVGKLIQQDFEKWLNVVTDKDCQDLGISGKKHEELIKMFDDELAKKPATKALLLAAIIHELRKDHEGQ